MDLKASKQRAALKENAIAAKRKQHKSKEECILSGGKETERKKWRKNKKESI